MPGCAAVGCNNRSEKGYIMKCFPRDAKLRKIWQERVGRADWEPSNNSFLCHVHFKPQEWSITHSGRIKLKKGAIPSIFTITSTRKSPKKRIKQTNIDQGKDDMQTECFFDGYDNDMEHSPAGNTESRDFEYRHIDQGLVDSSAFQTYIQSSESNGNREKHEQLLHQSVISDSQTNYTDDENRRIDSIIRKRINCDVERTRGLLSNDVDGVKGEVQPDTTSAFDDSYDEIEEKLKLICHEEPMESSKQNRNNHVAIRKIRDNGIGNIDNDVCTTISQGKCIRDEVSQMLNDKRENIEIIFGTESGDERIQVIRTLADKELSIGGYGKENKPSFPGGIGENFAKEDLHVIPNMRAALKRKRRTREEIMRSIQKSIGNTSDNDFNVISNNDLLENLGRIPGKETENEAEMDLSCPAGERTKFTIKVTGDPEDVNDIMVDLSSNAGNDVKTVGNHYLNNDLITSIVSVQGYVGTLPRERSSDSIYEGRNSIRNQQFLDSATNGPHLLYSDIERSVNRDASPLKLNNNEYRMLKHNNELEMKDLNSSVGRRMDTSVPPEDYQDLRYTVQLQEDVIKKLTDQLITYKRLENELSYNNRMLQTKIKEADALTTKLKKKVSQHPVYGGKKYLESKQRLITDLGNRVNYIEGVNKKLMKTVTLESQDKRKLESQIKQRDDRIKELNWKLQKASKYLERAEKNTNTYRRKMLNMQTVMRRKKLLDEKMSRFSEMLINSAKGEFSDKTLQTAVEIKDSCQAEGYKKLLDYGFPLPPVSVLQKKLYSTAFADSVANLDEDAAETGNANSMKPIKLEETLCVKDEINAEVKGADVKETELDGTETVTGTVQDIFDENNDADFSTNELREHFIMELNAVM